MNNDQKITIQDILNASKKLKENYETPGETFLILRQGESDFLNKIYGTDLKEGINKVI